MKAMVCVLIACGLAGCGESLCQRANRVGKALNNKGAPCVSGSTPVDVETCEQTSKQCTQADVEGIGRVLRCYEMMGNCAPENREAWVAQLRGCQDLLSPGSSACLAR